MNVLTYETLITCHPFFHIDILAGWNGKTKHCLNVFQAESEMPSEGNSLVLLNISNVTPSQLEEYLKNNNTTGILILSDQSCYLPSSITELANKFHKPLFALKNANAEVIAKRMKAIFHLNELNLLSLMKNDLTTFWLQLFNQQGIDYVLNRMNMFLGQEIFLFTHKRKFIPLVSNKYSEMDFKKVEKIETIHSSNNSSFSIVKYDKLDFYSFELSNPDQKILGYLLLEKLYSHENLPFQLLETMIPTIIAWLKQKEVTRNVHFIYKDQFLFDILHNNIDTESEIVELGRLRDMEFTSNAFVFSMNINSHRTITKELVMNIQQEFVENALEGANIFTCYLNHRIVSIVCPTIGNGAIKKNDFYPWIRTIQSEIHNQFHGLKTTIGIGRSYNSNLDIYKSFQESKIALEQLEIYKLDSESIINYEDLGFVNLLSYIHNDLLRDFSHQYLGELERYDEENETELFHTLTIFCGQNGDIVRTAESLFVHPNTLRQRLKKIESILGIELNNYKTLVNLVISLQIAKDKNI